MISQQPTWHPESCEPMAFKKVYAFNSIWRFPGAGTSPPIQEIPDSSLAIRVTGLCENKRASREADSDSKLSNFLILPLPKMMSFFKKPKPRKHCEECRSKGFQDMLNELEDPTKYAGVETVRKYYNNTAISLPSNASHINLVVWEIAKHSPQRVMACIDYFLIVMPPCRKKSFTNTLSAAGIQKMMQSINSCEDERERDGIQSEMFMRLCARVVTYNMDVWGASAAIGQVQSELLREVMLRYLLDPSRAFVKNLAQHKDFVVAFLSLYTTTSIQYPPVKSFLEAQVELYKPKPAPPAVRSMPRPDYEAPWGGACKRPRLPPPASTIVPPTTTTTTTTSRRGGTITCPPPPPPVSVDSLDSDSTSICNGEISIVNPRNSRLVVNGKEVSLGSNWIGGALIVGPNGVIRSDGELVYAPSSSISSNDDDDTSSIESEIDNEDNEFREALQQSIVAEQERKLKEKEDEIAQLKKKLKAKESDSESDDGAKEPEVAGVGYNDAECRVCMDAPPGVVYVDCKHMCVCAACHLEGKFKECPICRCPIKTTPIIPMIVT